MNRTAKVLAIPLFALQVIFFSYIALHRFVDGDEGFYLLASRLVIMHRRPYLDFFYTQAPLLPYIYGLWMKLFGISWVSAKILSAWLTAALGTLLYGEVSYQTRSWLTGLVAVIMFAGSGLVFGFYPVVKTYSLAGIFLFAAYVLVTRGSVTSGRLLTGVGGLLFGLSVDTRSYLVLLTPLFVWWIARNYDSHIRKQSVLWFLGGVVVGNAPAVLFFVASPNVFLFNNLGYHAVRSDGGLIGLWDEKVFALLQAFLGGAESNGVQTSILFFVGLGFVFSVRKSQYAPRLAFQIAMAAGLISLLPTPVHPQYFCLCAPFLLLTATCAVHELLAELDPGRWKVVVVVACGLIVAAYLAASVNDFRRYLVTGEEVAGVEVGLQSDYRMEHVLAVSQAVDEVAQAGEPVVSLWPGYIFQTKAIAYPGLENDFGLPVSGELMPEERARYRLVSSAQLQADFAVHTPRIVVLRNEIATPTNIMYRQKIRLIEGTLRASLLANGYHRSRSVGDVSIYVCRQK